MPEMTTQSPGSASRLPHYRFRRFAGEYWSVSTRAPVSQSGRVVNIGNSEPVQLTDYIAAIEAATGRAAIRNLMPMQAGDVPATWADTSLLQSLTGYAPKTRVPEGVQAFVDWYRGYYGV